MLSQAGLFLQLDMFTLFNDNTQMLKNSLICITLALSVPLCHPLHSHAASAEASPVAPSELGQYLQQLLTLPADQQAQAIAKQPVLATKLARELLFERVSAVFSEYPPDSSKDQLLQVLAQTLEQPELQRLLPLLRDYQGGNQRFQQQEAGLASLLAQMIQMAAMARGQRQAIAEHLLKQCQQEGLLVCQAEALNYLGWEAFEQKNTQQAVAWLTQSLTLSQTLGLKEHSGSNWSALGYVYTQQKAYAKAELAYAEAIRLAHETGNQQALMYRLGHLAGVHDEQQNYTLAKVHFNKALTLSRQLRQPDSEAYYLNGLGDIYYAQKAYTEAVPWYQQAAEINTQIQATNNLHINWANLGYAYQHLAQYSHAIEAFEKALILAHQFEQSESAATYLNEIGSIYDSQGQYDKALDFYQQSLEIWRSLKNQSGIAILLNNIGTIYNSWGHYDKALDYHQQSLEIRRSLKDQSGIANSLSHIGTIYESWGQYEKSLDFYQQSLEIDRTLNDQSGIASSLNNIGAIYKSWGQYDKALDYYQQSLAIERSLKDQSGMATSLNNIGSIYHSWGQVDKALDFYQQSLEIQRSLKDQSGIAISLNNIGGIYESWGQYEKALEHYQQSLEIQRSLKDQSGIARSLGNIGSICKSWGQVDKALDYHQQSLEIRRSLKDQSGIANSLSHIGSIYESWDQYDKALDYLQQSLAIAEQLGEKESQAQILKNIAVLYKNQNQPEAALKPLYESIALLEQLRYAIQGEARQDFMHTHIGTYESLIDTLTLLQRWPEALAALDQSKGRYLLDVIRAQQADAPQAYTPIQADTLQAQWPAETTTLLYSNTGWNESIQLRLNRQGLVAHRVSSTAALQKLPESYTPPLKLAADATRALPGDARGVIALDTAQRPADAIKNLENLVYFYRQLLSNPRSDLAQIKELGALLYEILIQPHEAALSQTRILQVVPDGVLGLLPFETLVDAQGRYLAERFQVQYIQSLSIEQMLQGRSYTAKRQPLLALGGPVYEPQHHGVTPVANDAMLRALQKQVWNFPQQHMGASYAALLPYLTLHQQGLSELPSLSWDPLPGTVREIQAIQQAVPGAVVLTGEQVNEASFKQRSASGELARYQVLHFATHGLAIPELPELSALVLSQFSQPQSEDGYLRAPEIAQLKLQADFVNLSACETGLGRVAGGEGVIGLTQAFLMAGANGISVSLWPVGDASTATFMQTLYTQQGDYGLRINEIKKQFLNGQHGERYRHPYYWAPFVYYGK